MVSSEPRHAELAFDGHADGVRHVHHALGHVDVVFVGAGDFLSSSNEPSIITEEKPKRIAAWQTAGDWPWSWCITTGMCG